MRFPTLLEGMVFIADGITMILSAFFSDMFLKQGMPMTAIIMFLLSLLVFFEMYKISIQGISVKDKKRR